MKAVFKGSNSIAHAFNFTKGKVYDVNFWSDGLRLISTIDDDGNEVSMVNGVTYNFDIINDTTENASLKYFINDIQVEKGFFYESIDELNKACSLGAKVSSVKFEIKFE